MGWEHPQIGLIDQNNFGRRLIMREIDCAAIAACTWISLAILVPKQRKASYGIHCSL